MTTERIYRTEKGSVVRGDGYGFTITFYWLEEGGCIDCTPRFDPDPSELALAWDCPYCGGGRAPVTDTPTSRKEAR
jgi:hypothetical protein